MTDYFLIDFSAPTMAKLIWLFVNVSKHLLLVDLYSNLVIYINLFKWFQVEGIIAKLDIDQKDMLMKYIYRGFESPSEGSSAHLVWRVSAS